MAFLNSAGLLNMGADAVKTASANQVTQESQTSGSDEFAQALRKQMQQNSKPVLPVANKAEAPKPTAADKAQPPQPSGTNNTASAKSEDGASNTVSNQPDEQKSAETTASTDADKTQAEDHPNIAKEPVVNETPQERKKRLLAELAANDQPSTGISPWMQTMIAMRPAATSDVQSKGEVAGDVTIATGAATVTDKPLLPVTAENTLPLENEALAKTTSNPVPTAPVATAGAEDKGIDFKQVLVENPQASAGKESVGLPETMVNAKLMAENGQEAGRATTAFSETRGTELQADVLNLASQPAAQALSNSQWLNAAGVTQASNVMMSQVAAPFGNERWQTAMNQHVMNMVSSGDDLASLTLSPPDLGPIQVVLKVDNQFVNTSFITDNPLVRQALEDGMQDLRDRMQSQGLQLGQTFVGDGQQAQQHFEQQTARQGSSSSLGATAEPDAVAPQTAVKTTVARGLVDTFV